MKTTKAFANIAFVWMLVVSLYNQNNVNGAPTNVAQNDIEETEHSETPPQRQLTVGHENNTQNELEERNGNHLPANTDSSLTGNRTSEPSKLQDSEPEHIFYDAVSETTEAVQSETDTSNPRHDAEIQTNSNVPGNETGLPSHVESLSHETVPHKINEDTVAPEAEKSGTDTSKTYQDAEIHSKPGNKTDGSGHVTDSEPEPVLSRKNSAAKEGNQDAEQKPKQETDNESSGPNHSEGFGSEQKLPNENSDIIKTLMEDAEKAKEEVARANNVNGAPTNVAQNDIEETEHSETPPQRQLTEIPIHGDHIQGQHVHGLVEDHLPNARPTETSLTGNKNSGQTHPEDSESEDEFHDATVGHENNTQNELEERNGNHLPANTDSSLTGNRTSEPSKLQDSEPEHIFYDAVSETTEAVQSETDTSNPRHDAEIQTNSNVPGNETGLPSHVESLSHETVPHKINEDTVAPEAEKSGTDTSKTYQDAEIHSKPGNKTDGSGHVTDSEPEPVLSRKNSAAKEGNQDAEQKPKQETDNESSGPNHSEGFGSEQKLPNENSARYIWPDCVPQKKQNSRTSWPDCERQNKQNYIIKTLMEDAEKAKEEVARANPQQPSPNADGHKPTENTERKEGENHGAVKKSEPQPDFSLIVENSHILQPNDGKDTETIKKAEKEAEETWSPLEEKAEAAEEARELGHTPESNLQTDISGNAHQNPATEHEKITGIETPKSTSPVVSPVMSPKKTQIIDAPGVAKTEVKRKNEENRQGNALIKISPNQKKGLLQRLPKCKCYSKPKTLE